MGIVIKLDRVMVEKKVKLNELAQNVGITNANMSNLKTGKAKAIRFSTLERICKYLNANLVIS